MQNTRIAQSALAILLLQVIFHTGAQSPVPQDVAIAVPLITDENRNTLNITSSTDDYVRQNQRQYAANIALMDFEMANAKSTYDGEVGTMTTQKDLLVVKLQEVDNKLYALQSLDDISKHCVQKYSQKLADPAKVQSNIANNIQRASSSFGSYYSTPTNTKNTLNSYYTITLVNELNACKKNNPNPSQNYTTCAVQAIAKADSNTSSKMQTFYTQMQSAHCSAEGRIRSDIQSIFTILYDAVFAAGEVTGLVDDCVQDMAFCSPCAPETVAPNCPKYMLKPSDFQNATINNPFYGSNGNITCVLIHL